MRHPHLSLHPIQPHLRKLLRLAYVSEIATGLALITAPKYVGPALVGIEPTGSGMKLGRCFGIALLALVYNLPVAPYLTWLGTAYDMHGILLWPAAVLDIAVTVLLVRLRAGAVTTPSRT